MPVKQITDGDTDGFSFGQATTDKIGFWGTTAPAAKQSSQPAAITTTALTTVATTAATSTSPFGFTSAQANDIITAVNGLASRVTELVTHNNLRRTNFRLINLE
jgi:hypothetical protein